MPENLLEHVSKLSYFSAVCMGSSPPSADLCRRPVCYLLLRLLTVTPLPVQRNPCNTSSPLRRSWSCIAAIPGTGLSGLRDPDILQRTGCENGNGGQGRRFRFLMLSCPGQSMQFVDKLRPARESINRHYSIVWTRDEPEP